MNKGTEKEILSLLRALKVDVSDLKMNVSGLKTDVGGLKIDVGGLKTDVGGLKTDLKVLLKISQSLAEKVAEHDVVLKQLVTKEDFAEFRDENVTQHDLLIKCFEELDQEFNIFESRQDRHEKALVENHLLTAA